MVEMDDGAFHLETIQEKSLPVDEINAYNLLAIYLRWCMEHDLMGEGLSEQNTAKWPNRSKPTLPVWICGRLSGTS